MIAGRAVSYRTQLYPLGWGDLRLVLDWTVTCVHFHDAHILATYAISSQRSILTSFDSFCSIIVGVFSTSLLVKFDRKTSYIILTHLADYIKRTATKIVYICVYACIFHLPYKSFQNANACCCLMIKLWPGLHTAFH